MTSKQKSRIFLRSYKHCKFDQFVHVSMVVRRMRVWNNHVIRKRRNVGWDYVTSSSSIHQSFPTCGPRGNFMLPMKSYTYVLAVSMNNETRMYLNVLLVQVTHFELLWLLMILSFCQNSWYWGLAVAYIFFLILRQSATIDRKFYEQSVFSRNSKEILLSLSSIFFPNNGILWIFLTTN